MKLGAHIKQSSEDHMLKLNQNLTRVLEEEGRIKRSMDSVVKCCKVLERKVDGLHVENKALREKVSEMERQLDDAKTATQERDRARRTEQDREIKTSMDSVVNCCKALERKVDGLQWENEVLRRKVSEMERQLKDAKTATQERDWLLKRRTEDVRRQNERRKETTNRKRKGFEVTMYFLPLYHYAIM